VRPPHSSPTSCSKRWLLPRRLPAAALARHARSGGRARAGRAGRAHKEVRAARGDQPLQPDAPAHREVPRVLPDRQVPGHRDGVRGGRRHVQVRVQQVRGPGACAPAPRCRSACVCTAPAAGVLACAQLLAARAVQTRAPALEPGAGWTRRRRAGSSSSSSSRWTTATRWCAGSGRWPVRGLVRAASSSGLTGGIFVRVSGRAVPWSGQQARSAAWRPRAPLLRLHAQMLGLVHARMGRG